MNNPTLTIKEHRFTLSAAKTIYWQNKDTLLLSDLHLGKKQRLISKSYNLESELQRFENAVNEFNPKRILILGDLFDAKATIDRKLFAELVSNLNREIILVLGNHDILSADIYKNLGINKITNELKEDMFLFTHKPENFKSINIHGHLHPGIKSKTKLNLDTKLACFCVKENSICLPAFGGSTGKSILNVNSKKDIYVIKKQSVKLLV